MTEYREALRRGDENLPRISVLIKLAQLSSPELGTRRSKNPRQERVDATQNVRHDDMVPIR